MRFLTGHWRRTVTPVVEIQGDRVETVIHIGHRAEEKLVSDDSQKVVDEEEQQRQRQAEIDVIRAESARLLAAVEVELRAALEAAHYARKITRGPKGRHAVDIALKRLGAALRAIDEAQSQAPIERTS